MQKNAVVTICSINYLAKALVLHESFSRHHPDHAFYVVIVDRKNDDFVIGRPEMKMIWAEDLPILNFHQAAFSFDVIEFNTNVKPTAMKVLLEKYDSVIYLDPDIEVFAPLTPVFDGLKNASIVLTPHSNTPILDGCKPDDLEFLKFGTFNLGFAAVSKCDEAFAFLDWWSARCLEHGFYEPQAGLAVDQKWVSLAPSYFPNLKILHHEGLNLAFWNLHERYLSLEDSQWLVNGKVPLCFIHFSSFNTSKPETIAQKQNRFAAGSRPDFELVAKAYAAKLIAAESDKYSKQKYGFDYFDDGTYITPALRRFYAALRQERFSDVVNPFEKNGPVKDFAKRNGLLVNSNIPAKRHNFHDVKFYGLQIKIIFKMLRFVLYVIGPERYFNLMRYLAHVSSLRNQTDIFKSKK
ncbi:MAG: glycosyl transferase [Collimonas sp.]|uniref:glycosyl transferase n=1 Tax=Collimonas sp. TaxID=1963772 RepID=UPI0032679978